MLSGPAILNHGDLEGRIRHREKICWDDEPVVGTEPNPMDKQSNAQS